MKLAGEYTFHAPVEEVWKALLDPVVLAATMPGCERLDLINGQYVGELNIKIGPVQGKFTGKIDLEDISELQGYTIKVDGRGAPGFVNALAKVTLTRKEAETVVAYDADANVGGKVASVGQRLLEASAKAIIKQSLDGLHENVKVRHAATVAYQASLAATQAAPVEPPPPQPTHTEATQAPPAEATHAAATAPAAAPAAPAEPAAPEAPTHPAPAPTAAAAETAPTVPPHTAPTQPPHPAPVAQAAPPPPPPPPVIRVDQAKLAAAVAKEVTQSLIPPGAIWAAAGVAALVILYFVFGR